MQSFQTDFITKRGQNAIKFHEVLSDTVRADGAGERVEALSQLINVLDPGYSIQNSDGQVRRTPSLTHSLTHSLTRSLTRSLTLSHTHSLTRSRRSTT